MLNNLHVALHALQLLQATVQHLQILEQGRAPFALGDQFPRQECQLVRERVSEERELLRSVQLLRGLLACLGYDGIKG